MPYNNNNKQQEFAISTSLLSIFDDNSCQLRLSGYDNGLSVAIWNPLYDQMGKTTYPQEGRDSTILSIDKVASLYDGIIKKILPAFEKGQDASCHVFTNKNRTSIFGVSCQNGDFYCTLSTGLDPTTFIASKVSTFKFLKTPIIEGYNPTTGEMNAVPVDGYFYIFYQMLSVYTTSITAGHGVRYTDRISKDKLFRYMEGIASKLGVTVAANTYSRAPYNQQQQGAVTQTAGNVVQENVQMQEVTDMGTLL